MKKTSMETITARDLSEGGIRMVMMHPRTNRAEYLNTAKTIRPQQVVRFDMEHALSRIERWIDTVTPDDVTYYGSFRSTQEYAIWRTGLLCGDREVRWDVTVETADGRIKAYICTSNVPLPQVFKDVCQDLEKFVGGAA